MTKHTPGPWEIHGDQTRETHYVYGSNAVCDIRKPSGFYRSPAETEANARLIAAAPEMLEALKKIHSYFITENIPGAIFPDDDYFNTMERESMALIQKVEGL